MRRVLGEFLTKSFAPRDGDADAEIFEVVLDEGISQRLLTQEDDVIL